MSRKAALKLATASPPALETRDDLDQQKSRLEIEKIKEEVLEIQNSRRWWPSVVTKAKATEWVTAVATIAALLLGWQTGLFDAVRHNLSAQQERLKIETIHLEHQREKLTGEVTAKQQEIETLKRRLLPFEQEESAFKELRTFDKKLLQVRFGASADFDGIRVSVSSLDKKPDWNILGFPETRTSPHLLDALKLIGRARVLNGLKISELQTMPEEIALASRHEELESLVIEYAGLNTGTLRSLKRLPKCSLLVLRGNEIKSLHELLVYPSVTTLDVSGNPLGDDAVASLVTSFPNLERLNLAHTHVSDAGAARLVQLRALSTINLSGTRVTGSGALTLLSCPNLAVIDIDKDVVNDQQRAVMKKSRPNLSGFVHKGGEYRWGGDW